MTTTTTEVERRLREAFAQAADATEPGARPDVVGEDEPTVGTGRVPRSRRTRVLALAAAGVVVVAAIAGIVVARTHAGDDVTTEPDPVTSTVPPAADETLRIESTVVEVPVSVPGYGSPAPAPVEDPAFAPPAVDYPVGTDARADVDPANPVGITVTVTRSPDTYAALVARDLDLPIVGLAPTGAAHDIAGRWVVEGTRGPVIDDPYSLHLVFAVGDFSVVQVDTTQSLDEALALVERIVAPPASNVFTLPCSGQVVASDITTLQLPPDISRHPQRGWGSDDTRDRECARTLRGTTARNPEDAGARGSITFVEDLDTPLTASSGGQLASRNVFWSVQPSGDIVAEVSHDGGTFGVVAVGLTEQEWAMLAWDLASQPN